ncbi:MAG TPA: Uma2 family endonuclease [Thermoanaerobaculia bacterium]|jgi:Uma2 family endonuclease
MAPQTSTKLTYEDYLQLPDDGNRYEIIDGELVLNPTPVFRHQRILGNLFFALELHFRSHGGGLVVVAPFDVVLSPHQMYEPDLLIVLDEHRSIVTEKNVTGAPDLVVEILSPGTRSRDEKVKRANYERYGVSEYWLVDPEDEVVMIDRRVGGAFVRAAVLEYEKGDTLATPLIPGFSLSLAEVFAP